MKRLILKRLVSMPPVVLVVTMITFSLVLLLPGDPAAILLGEEGDAELLEKYRKELGLDRPIHIQYIDWLSDVVRGDWHHSLRTHLPITEEIKNRLPVTLELGLLGLALALAISIPVGIISAARPNTLIDNISTLVAMFGVAIPNFWLGILLIYLFSVFLGWFPATGFVPLSEDVGENLKGMIMPTIAFGTSHAAVLLRQTRSGMLEVLRQDYVRTAFSKGLAERQVMIRHALKNALIPLITIAGLEVGQLLGGSVIVETIFGLPGVGRLAVTGVIMNDLPVVQGVLLMFAFWVILANLAADISYGFVDPRIRYQ